MTGGEYGGAKAAGRFLGQWLLDCLFPKYCLACGREGDYWCDGCKAIPPPSYPSVCLGCKVPVSIGQLCMDCGPRYAFDGLLIGADYEHELVSSLVRACKYRFVSELADNLALLAQRSIVSLLENEDTGSLLPGNFFSAVVVPIPLSIRRRRWRGFNQAELIAKSIAENCRLTYNDTLVRRLHRRAQATLGEKARRDNLQGSFSINEKAPELILLVDDVITTGSTLNECAKELKRAGAREVWGLAAAKG